MEVILLEKVSGLGNLGDRVKVKSGFGRNFLIPYGHAVSATSANVAQFEQRRAALESASAERRAAADARAAKLADLKVTITANAGDEGKLFGSIGTTDIAEACQAAGQTVERSEVRLPGGPIRAVGEHVITLHLHSDINIEVPLTVIAEE